MRTTLTNPNTNLNPNPKPNPNPNSNPNPNLNHNPNPNGNLIFTSTAFISNAIFCHKNSRPSIGIIVTGGF